MDYGFYFTGSLEAMTNVQLVGNNGTLCFLQELLLLCVFLQLLSSFRYFLSYLFTDPFQAVSDGSHYREVRFHYLQCCEGSGQRACQSSQKEGRTKLIEGYH
jgi:hypothetical protein